MVSENLLTFAAQKYGFHKETLHFISESTNQIYAFQKADKWYILRFSQKPKEQARQTKAEMDWLYYLAQHDIGVSLPLAADHDALVLCTEDDGKSFVISAFDVLPGTFWNKNDPAYWNEKIFYNWGRVMGDIHRLTKAYMPANQRDVRGHFTGHEALALERLKHCPAVYCIAEELISEIMALPKDKDGYGLIHCDMHPWNFIIDGEKVNVFDFDDCLYGWFALDIGIALYHGLWWGRVNDAGHVFAREMIKSFLDGYASANALNAFWIAKVPLFMRYRQVCKFSWFYTPGQEDEHQRERIRNIENGVLFSDLVVDGALFGG